ncbi:NADH:flavin oxidoreductase/NADH oxidase [Streptomyces sp. NBC_00582]|uniref:NADH:flavin oxidoreductase/NADH oxidase n=1 Tax=Streptomyces sp. NBC_00582 TaxID=2975783 RepID=UPI002E808970|nr:NADH:flavin oxidoreductase/NADH oxidase [Streptomyces sp. NBC_00582]WUB67404.1 NADH:flavin oxidoreductase/NADH oxidase [Streptomyces sp. NBC_00582]
MPLLFEPCTLRGVSVRNRIWLSPMCQYSCVEEDGMPHDWHLAHLGARAQTGFGLIMSEAVAVDPVGRITPQDAGLWNDRQAEGWARIVDFVHAQGAAFGFQISHAGRKASTWRGFPGEPSGVLPPDRGGWTTVAPSTREHPGRPAPRALTRDEMKDVATRFADAARRAHGAGADVLEIHAAHGYLLHEFLSPLANDRTDEYGGSFEGRVRFPLEVVEAVRKVWPDRKPLFVRVSATDWLPDAWDIEQTSRFAGLMRERGVDLVDVSSGSIAPADIPATRGYQVPLAARIREDNGIPTAAVGLILDPKQAEAVLTAGEADAVFLGRVALREAAWPLRAAQELGMPWTQAPYPGQYTRARWDAIPDV